jgi:hypothetical protein
MSSALTFADEQSALAFVKDLAAGFVSGRQSIDPEYKQSLVALVSSRPAWTQSIIGKAALLLCPHFAPERQ